MDVVCLVMGAGVIEILAIGGWLSVIYMGVRATKIAPRVVELSIHFSWLNQTIAIA